MADVLVDRVDAQGRRLRNEPVDLLAHRLPGFAGLDFESQRRIAQAVAVDELKAQLKAAVDMRRIDYHAERDRFLSRAGSSHTARAYCTALMYPSDICG